jgi:hypothetical protein
VIENTSLLTPMHNFKSNNNNYLDQLREQVRLMQLGIKEQKKRQPTDLYGLPSIYDHINTNTKDSKK